MGTAIIAGIIVILCFIGIRSTVKRFAYGCCNGGQDKVKKKRLEDKDLSNYPYTCTIAVEGMTCGNCKRRVENELNEKEGIYAVVDLKQNMAKIHLKEQVPEDTIRNTIRHSGYTPGRCKKNY